ncbi:MAG: hypothetical protein ACYCZO_01940 [Daejeonella sp.]
MRVNLGFLSAKVPKYPSSRGGSSRTPLEAIRDLPIEALNSKDL